MYDEPTTCRGGAAELRERLESDGPEALRDGELVAVAVGVDGDAVAELADRYDPREVVNMAPATLAQIVPGVGARKALALVASFEIARRGLARTGAAAPVISCPADTLPYLAEIKDQDREHFIALYLNARNTIITREVVSIGSVSASIVHPREVFIPAVKHVAASILMAHNHPSGDTTPSKEDVELTRRMVEAGGIMGVDILDHIIVTETDFLSLKERGLM